jgi:hypothetical protein
MRFTSKVTVRRTGPETCCSEARLSHVKNNEWVHVFYTNLRSLINTNTRCGGPHSLADSHRYRGSSSFSVLASLVLNSKLFSLSASYASLTMSTGDISFGGPGPAYSRQDASILSKCSRHHLMQDCLVVESSQLTRQAALLARVLVKDISLCEHDHGACERHEDLGRAGIAHVSSTASAIRNSHRDS